MKLLGRFLMDQKIYLFSYLGIAGLFAFTMYLYEIPFIVFQDSLLFSGFLLLGILFVQFIYYLIKHRKLQQGIRAPKLYQEGSVGKNLIEEDYEQLFLTLKRSYEAEIRDVEKNNQQLMNYYSMWTHQIKTPLAVLHLKMQENQLDSLVLKQELFKVDQYLDMMLQYLRLNHAETDFVFTEISIERLVKETVKKYSTFFIHKDLSITILPTEKVIVSDRKWLEFVLEQLIFNAIKYTEKGGLTIYLNPEDEQELIVEDSGIGVLPEDLNRVFEKGYTGFNGHTYQKASGLGLYLSKMILNQLGHQIRMTSEVGKGTKVYLNFKQTSYQPE